VLQCVDTQYLAGGEYSSKNNFPTCCGVTHPVTLCCSVLQRVAMCLHNTLPVADTAARTTSLRVAVCCSVLQYVVVCCIVCCIVLQCVYLAGGEHRGKNNFTTCCSVLQYVAVRYIVLQCVAVCYIALQRVAMCLHSTLPVVETAARTTSRSLCSEQ